MQHEIQPAHNPEVTPGPNKPDIEPPQHDQPESPLPPASPDPLPHPEPGGPEIKE